MRTRDEADTVQLSKIRIKERVRAALDRAATENGITLNAEIARRLERSLDREKTITELKADMETIFGGRRAIGIFHALASATEAMFGDDGWLLDHRKFIKARELWNKILDDMTPAPEGGWVVGLGRDCIEMLKQKGGQSDAARGMLLEIVNRTPPLIPPDIRDEFLAAASADYPAPTED